MEPVLTSRKPRTYRDYAWRCFHNVYNYTLLGAAATSALMTDQWWILLAALGLEALWMIYAPDSKLVRRKLDEAMDRDEREERARRREEELKKLSRADQVRCQALMSKEWEITHLAAENPTFSGELLRGEIAKLDQLVDSFIDLASTSARYREYLDREDIGEVERLGRSYEKEAENAEGHVREMARKNLAIVKARLERLREIKEFVDRATGQLELIENSFALLADQIVSMRSPGELSGQLDELIDGVDAVRQTARESERLLEPA